MSIKYFVYYDDNGNIYTITNEKKSEGNFLEVDDFEVTDFLTGVKDFAKFKIQTLVSGKKKIEEASVVHEQLVYKDFCLIGFDNPQPEMQIMHDTNNEKWSFSVPNGSKVATTEYYICKSTDFNFLVRTIKVPPVENYSIKFETDYELTLDSIILLTKKIYKSYGIVKHA